jgi:hypothetical protein
LGFFIEISFRYFEKLPKLQTFAQSGHPGAVLANIKKWAKKIAFVLLGVLAT